MRKSPNSIFKAIFTTLVIFSIVFISSCSEDNDTPALPTKGTLLGNIQTFDDKLISTSDNGGVTVSASNLTGQTFTTTTDNTGRYTFNELPFDNYQFEISKTGYGTLKVFGISHVYNKDVISTIVQNITFGKLSTTTVTGLSFKEFSINGEVGVSFDYNLSPVPTPSNKAFVRYFLSTSANVSNSNFTARTEVLSFSSLSANTGFTKEKLLEMGFTTGQTVYVRMYGDSFISNNWEDPTSGVEVFPNINPTTVAAVSFVVPN
jgi:hypothetical protein